MMLYKKNTVVLIRFPFSDFSQTKKRPALILRDQVDKDILCVPISSQVGASRSDLLADEQSCEGFKFPIKSVVRWQKVMTIESELVEKSLGKFSERFFQETKKHIIDFIKK